MLIIRSNFPLSVLIRIVSDAEISWELFLHEMIHSSLVLFIFDFMLKF